MKFSGKRNAALLAAASAAALSSSAWATSRNYVGPNNGNYNTAANWSPSGVPQEGDDLFFGNVAPSGGISGNETVTLNTTTNYLDSVTINSSALPAYFILNETTGGTLIAVNGNGTENIGTTTSDNELSQSGGSSNSAEYLNVGVSGTADTYALTGANTNLGVGFEFNLGVTGAGLMSQSGGLVIVDDGAIDGNTAVLTLGVNAGSFGTYNLSAGTLQADNTNIGSAGSAIFNLSGGTFQSSAINIGSTTAGDSAELNFSGGALQGYISSQTMLEVNAGGQFNISGGANFGSQAIYTTVNPGGVLNFLSPFSSNNISQVFVYGGLMQLNGNNVSLYNLEGTLGTIQNGSTTPAVLTLNNELFIGSTQPILYDISSNIIDGGSASLGVTVPVNCGVGVAGLNTYSGPTSVAGVLQAQANGAFSPNSNVTLTAGTLDAQAFNVSAGSIAGSGQVNILAGGTLTAGTTGLSTSLSAILTGAGVLNKAGVGTMTMTGGGPFTGTINVQGGYLAVGALNGIPTGATLNLSGLGTGLQVNASQTIATFSSGVLNGVSFSNNSTLTFGTNNSSTSIGTDFSGTGSLVKVGTGTVNLGYGDNIGNSDTALTINVNAGTLALAKAAGTTDVAGPLVIGGGTVLYENSNQINGNSAVTINSGTFDLAGYSDTIASLQGSSSASVILAGGTLTVQQATNTTFGGGLSGPGLFNKNGVGTLTLSNVGNFGGALNANGGELVLQGPVTSTGFTANSGGNLEFLSGTVNLSNSPIISNAGGTVLYFGANINNGFLRGAGAHVITGSSTSTFSGIQTFNSATITQNGPASFNDFTNGGTFNNNSAVTFTGAVNDTSGILNVSNVANTQDFTNNGVINVAAGGSIVNSLSDFYIGGGARMYIGTVPTPGGTLTLQGGTTLEVNGGLLVNEGTISGTTDVNYAGTAEGAGTYGPVNVTFGGVFQPGFTSMGASIPSQGAIVTSLTGAGTVDDESAGGNVTLTDNSTAVSTFTGVIQNTTGTLGLTLSGAGGLTLLTETLPGGIQSTNTYSGGTTINGGTLTIGATGALPAGKPVVNNGTFDVLANSVSGNISGNGTTTIGQSALLKIAANTGVSTQGGLVVGAGSTLDVTNNTLFINYGSTADPMASIASYLTSGYSGGKWTGAGIDSSIVASLDATQSKLIYDVGYADGADGIVNGLSAGQIEILPTLAGDAKLQGNVVFGDFQVLAQYFGKAGGWDEGNFTYGTTIDFGDFQQLAQDFGATDSALTSGEFASLNSFAGQFGDALVANSNGVGFSLVSVPEPASIGVVAFAGFALLSRRRRRRR